MFQGGPEGQRALDEGCGFADFPILVTAVKLLTRVKCERRHTSVINLSKTFYLTDPEEEPLKKGLTFIPGCRGGGHG